MRLTKRNKKQITEWWNPHKSGDSTTKNRNLPKNLVSDFSATNTNTNKV